MDKIYLGNKIENFESSEPFLPISRVILKVDSQNGYIAGDESGRTIEKTMPWATQAMANSILASLKGQVYKPFSGSGALLDPAAELGDALTVAGSYGILAGMSRQLDRMGIADISAPGADELDDEFPYTPKSQRDVERVLGKAYSRISKTAEKILFEVRKDLENYSTIEQTAASIKTAIQSVNNTTDGKLKNYSTIKQTSDSISTAVTSINESVDGKLKNYSTIKQTSDSISAAVSGFLNGSQVDSKITTALSGIKLSVSNGETSSIITLKYGSTEIKSPEIKFTGNVVFSSDLSTAGKTSINGENLMTGTVTASTIKGDKVEMLDGDGNLAAELYMGASSSALTGGYTLNIRSAATAIFSEVGDVFIKSYNQTQNNNFSSLLLTIGGIYTRGHLVPSNDKEYDLGHATCIYRTAYVANGVVSLSDRREKRDIDYDLTRYDALFDDLAPCSFRFADGDRVHIGMISQDVEERMEQCGIDSMELAAFIKSPDENGGYRYGLRYSEFISLLIDQVQKLKKRVKYLEEAA